jgi:hypothetical protein
LFLARVKKKVNKRSSFFQVLFGKQELIVLYLLPLREEEADRRGKVRIKWLKTEGFRRLKLRQF